jgi:hypothetical protein
VSLKLLIGLVILCGTGLAHAERAITVDVAAGPLTATELVAAIRARLPADGAPVRVAVTPTQDGVRVEAHGGTRDIALTGLDHAAAIRLVALAANDLLFDDLASLPESPPSAVPLASFGNRPSATLGFLGGAAGWDGILGGLTVDAALARGGWLAAIDVTGGTLVDNSVSLSTAVIRLSGGARAGLFELRGGLTLAPLVVQSGAGDRTVLVGAGASVRLRIPLAPRLRGVLAIGADAFATRTEYLVEGMQAMTTPRIAPWLAAGLEVTP